MTKLLEWATLAGMFVSAWLALLGGRVVEIDKKHMIHVQLLPLYAVAIFGASCLVLLVWRTITFNDCPEAADELRKQIKEARTELSAKGMTFKKEA